MRFAWVLSLLVVGCTQPIGKDDMPPPWHMWGASQQFEIISAPPTAVTVTKQLVRINYGRPETWRWFFAASILGGTVSAAGATVVVVYDVTFGVGRSQSTIRLGRFSFALAAGAIVPVQKFANNINGPPHDDAVPLAPNVINSISAQDIQVAVTVQFLDVTAAEVIQVDVSGYFSPETHIRPEWMATPPLFPGDETKGK